MTRATQQINIFYDCEFLDSGSTIDLVSVGMCNDQDDNTLYLFNADAMLMHANDWVRANVFPHLPLCKMPHTGGPPHFDKNDTRVMGRSELAKQVADYVRGYGAWPTVQLWADYGAYDHVAIAQMFGPMVNLPEGFPMYTNEYMTYETTMRDTLGAYQLFRKDKRGNPHDALDDAKWVRYKHSRVKDCAQAALDRIVHSCCNAGQDS